MALMAYSHGVHNAWRYAIAFGAQVAMPMSFSPPCSDAKGATDRDTEVIEFGAVLMVTVMYGEVQAHGLRRINMIARHACEYLSVIFSDRDNTKDGQ